MISLDALNTFLQALITAAGNSEPLKDAALFKNLLGSTNEAKKVVRADCYSGRMELANEADRQENDVDFVVECIVTPAEATESLDELQQLDAAKALSFEMARAICGPMQATGMPGVCDVRVGDFDIGPPSFGAQKRGATFLYGKINP